jgi:hypothetical protein
VYVPGRRLLLETAADVLAGTITPADAIALAVATSSGVGTITGEFGRAR